MGRSRGLPILRIARPFFFGFPRRHKPRRLHSVREGFAKSYREDGRVHIPAFGHAQAACRPKRLPADRRLLSAAASGSLALSLTVTTPVPYIAVRAGPVDGRIARKDARPRARSHSPAYRPCDEAALHPAPARLVSHLGGERARSFLSRTSRWPGKGTIGGGASSIVLHAGQSPVFGASM